MSREAEETIIVKRKMLEVLISMGDSPHVRRSPVAYYEWRDVCEELQAKIDKEEVKSVPRG